MTNLAKINLNGIFDYILLDDPCFIKNFVGFICLLIKKQNLVIFFFFDIIHQ
jgi:hypothetical protein